MAVCLARRHDGVDRYTHPVPLLREGRKQLDLIIGEGPAARSVRIDLQPFTLVGATTRAGLVTTPLRDRFGIPLRLIFYTHRELEEIVRRGRSVPIPTRWTTTNEVSRSGKQSATKVVLL